MKVSEQELRRRFNDGRYWDRVQTGELVALLGNQSHPASPLAHEPICTWSQTMHYYQRDGTKVAVVHQYLRPDGTLGLSGKPDPKKLHEGDAIYTL